MALSKTEKDILDEAEKIVDGIAKNNGFYVARSVPSKEIPNQRVFRCQKLGTDKLDDDSAKDRFKQALMTELDAIDNFTAPEYWERSNNSGKYSSVSTDYRMMSIDIVIARGANKGEDFESEVINDFQRLAALPVGNSIYANNKYVELLRKLEKAHPDFKANEFRTVSKGFKGKDTFRRGKSPKEIGMIVGDMVITDTAGNRWSISLKNETGFTIANMGISPSNDQFFDARGELLFNSYGATILKAFGVDMNRVQAGFDVKANKAASLTSDIYTSNKTSISKEASKHPLKKIFEEAWGSDYFYVRKATNEWKVMWIDKVVLEKLTGNLRINHDMIRYPGKERKQVTIYAENSHIKYVIEIRNTSGGLYPKQCNFRATWVSPSLFTKL